jgi:hypothetical protein
MLNVLEEIEIYEDELRGLYRDSWTGVIVPEAFAHPAKYSRALIRFIYQHVIDCGWIKPGDSVVDPFGGVALGGLDAMRHGLHWTGRELEEKFVGLGNQNIALWNDRYSRMPNWGTARLVQGDSRNLASALSAADCCVSSPPYSESLKPETEEQTRNKQQRIALSKSIYDGRKLEEPSAGKAGLGGGYGTAEGNLGAMKEGDLRLAISSPPYSESMNRAGGIDPDKSTHIGGPHSQMNRSDTRYGAADGQLGAMKEGEHSMAITSPPYNPPMSQDHNGSKRGTTPSEKGAFVKYDNTGGRLEGLPMDGFDAAISSPPYESGCQQTGHDLHPDRMDGRYVPSAVYSDEPDNLGNQRGETFWSASRIILEQLHQVLMPDAHAVFVVKAFVRNKQIVDFPSQWAQLCEAVGFNLVHHHKALLTEEYGTQTTFHGEDKTLKVSFADWRSQRVCRESTGKVFCVLRSIQRDSPRFAAGIAVEERHDVFGSESNLT